MTETPWPCYECKRKCTSPEQCSAWCDWAREQQEQEDEEDADEV